MWHVLLFSNSRQLVKVISTGLSQCFGFHSSKGQSSARMVGHCRSLLPFFTSNLLHWTDSQVARAYLSARSQPLNGAALPLPCTSEFLRQLLSLVTRYYVSSDDSQLPIYTTLPTKTLMPPTYKGKRQNPSFPFLFCFFDFTSFIYLSQFNLNSIRKKEKIKSKLYNWEE